MHGSNNNRCQKTVWELAKITIKVNRFSLYTYFLACHETLFRIISQINNEFTSYAYVYYRRSMKTTDISVVILSMFVIDEKKEEIKKLLLYPVFIKTI